MKLAGREAKAYLARPDAARTGLLLYGADAMRVALKRQQVIAALIGPSGEEEMRLARLPAAALRADPAALLDAIKAQGFFPGPRVVFVEDAADGLSKTIGAALAQWQPGDAQIVVTARQLPARSSLRKLFEAHKNAYATGIYDDPPNRDEITEELCSKGLPSPGTEAMEALTVLSRSLDPGDFRQLIEKISLFKLNDDTPLTADEALLLAPASTEAAVDDVLNIVAEGKSREIAPVMGKLAAQGVQPVKLCIDAMRHFRTLHRISVSGLQGLRPPLFGPRRDRMQRQAQNWGTRKLETAIELLLDTDLALRSSARAPAMALTERALLRLSMLAAKR